PGVLVGGIGLLLEEPEYVGVAGAARLAGLPRRQLAQLVARDGQQPAAERAPGGVVLEVRRRPGDPLEHLLGEVGRVGILEPAAPAVRVAQRGVDLHELAPREAVLRVADAKQQARACGTRTAHDRSPTVGRAAGTPAARRPPRFRLTVATAGEQAIRKCPGPFRRVRAKPQAA